MPKYPSTETFDKCNTRELNRRQRMYYQEKELILTEKLALAENAYSTRESLDMTLEQAQLNRSEYDNIKRDLEEKRKYCFQMLLLPNQEIPKYPTPPSVKTRSSELDEEQVNYYLDKSKEVRQIETIRYHVYLTRLAQAVNEEEKEQCQIEGQDHEHLINKLQEKIRIALEEAIRKPKSAPQTSRESKEPPEGDYLDLERTLSTPQVLEVTKQRLEELIKQTSETKDNLTKEQQVVDENIKQNLESMGMIRHGPSEKVIEEENKTERKKVSPPALMIPQPQRERVTRTHVRSIGENSIPIRYSKELGRNGGIEQPTSTEARKSQNSALQTAKEFLNGNEYKNKRVEIDTPVGEPQQELDWDGLQEPLREPHTQPKESGYQTTRSTKTTPELRTKNSMQSKERIFQKKGQNLRNKVITMPWPPFTKIYKRKVGDSSNKIYSDEGMYGDEKDDLFAKEYCGSDQEVDLFDIICEHCHGDHMVMYCPYNPDRTLKQELEKQSPDRTRINVDYTVSTPCWNCNGKHYYRNCPEKEWHGQLEKAREQSDDLHLSLLYNSKGYARLHHLTQQQIQAIKRSQITPEPQNSTKSPYVRVHPEREEVENSRIKFKSPPRELRPPRKIMPPSTPKFDLGGMGQKSLTQEDGKTVDRRTECLGA